MNTCITQCATEKKADPKHVERKLSPFGRLFRFIGLWFGFAGLYSMFSVCPFCGQPGCPVGLASAGAVGAFFTLCIQDWKLLLRFLKSKLIGNQTSGLETKTVEIHSCQDSD